MASPLAPYINARVLFPGVSTVAMVNGRYESTTTEGYLVKAFLKRQQYTGVSSGSKRIPLESQLDGFMMPGASGDQFFYRGYSLLWAEVPLGYDLEVPAEDGLTFQEVTEQYLWMKTGTEVNLKFGFDPLLVSRIQRTSGVFGGVGIDEIVYPNIGGIQLQLTGGEIQN